MSEKFGSSRIIKIGIVTDDVEKTAAYYSDLFEEQPHEAVPKTEYPQPLAEQYKEYKGVRYSSYDKPPLKVKIVNLDPVYFEIVQPLDDTPSPWSDHLKKFGTSVCFISFHVEGGFEQQIDMMGRKGFPLSFREEKGFQRYAYFDTQDKLGLLLELKDLLPREK